MRLVIIDTGVERSSFIEKNIISGISVINEHDKLKLSENIKDNIGHGTAVVGVVLQYLKNKENIEIFMFKIYSENDYENIDKLKFALDYIYNQIECDVIQISSGVLLNNCSLYELIKKMVQKGILVVSAFDNEGTISYPAAYEEVLGVDIDINSRNKEEYDVVDGNVVDIRVGHGYYRTIDNYGKKYIVDGSSFATSYIVSQIINNMNSGNLKKEVVKKVLALESKQVMKTEGSSRLSNNYKQFSSCVKNVVVFPFNKEIHSLARFEKLMGFENCRYFDIKHKFLIGKKVKDVIPDTENSNLIDNIEELNWNDNFDMFICGHVMEIEKLLGVDYRKRIFELCKKHNKKLFCFDNMFDVIPMKDYGKKILFPYYDNSNIPSNRFGKLRKPNVPILAVLGTSSRQGKYTIQLKLRQEIEGRGVNVGFLSTEPNGSLLQADETLSFGYGTNCFLNEKLTNVANEMIWNIERKNVDMIITGCQSGTLQYDTSNENLLSYNQMYFLSGINPDGIILCVNSFDELSYIKRTILFIEALTNAKLIYIIISRVRENKVRCENKQIIDYFIQKKIEYMNLESLNINLLGDSVLDYYGG